MLIIKSRDLHLWDKYPKGRRVGFQTSPGYIASQTPDWPEPVSTTTKTTGEVGGGGGIYPSVVNACHHSTWEGKARRTRSSEPITPQVSYFPSLWLWCGSYCTAQASLKPDMWSSTPSHLQSSLLILPGYSGGRSVPPQLAETLSKGLTSRSLSEKSSLWECPCSGGEFESLVLMNEKQISLVFALPCHLGFHIIYLKLQITAKPHSNYNTNRIRSLMYK